MLPSYLSSKFPAEDVSDGQHLYRSLGSFWTQLFKSKNELKGYTTGMAEELIQSYYTLLENIRKYSVKDIDILHKEKWLPIVIKRSEYNKSPFVFEKNAAVFGYQPNTDLFYAGQLFRFGEAKHTDGADVYSFHLKDKVAKFSVVCDKIIAPSTILLNGVDVVLQEGTLYFNSDIFNNPKIPKTKIIQDLGVPATFIDAAGNIVEDELIILWLYSAELDEESLYANFGTLLDIKMPSSEAYKDTLKALVNLYVEGPTISALNTIFAVMAGCPVILESTETIEEIYADSLHQYIISDKHIYRVSLAQIVAEFVVPGATLYAGDILTTDVLVLDNLLKPTWWLTDIDTHKLAFAQYIFNADIKSQLFFENAERFVECQVSSSGDSIKREIVFPVTGNREDVAAFHTYINKESSPEEKAKKDTLLRNLELQQTVSSRAPINPLNFILTNFLKSNTLLLKLTFNSEEQMDTFLSVFPSLENYLPPHVYVLVYVRFKLTIDDLSYLNFSLDIPGFPGALFSCDGSISSSGARPGGTNDHDYYKDYKNRLFCLAVGPYKNVVESDPSTKAPLNAHDNISELVVNHAGSGETASGIICGTLRTEIPEYINSPGESIRKRPSTKEIPSILLIDF